MLVDSHCHLHLIDYTKLGLNMDEVVQNALSKQVNELLCVATHTNETDKLLEIAKLYDCVKVSIGLHPNDDIEHEPDVADYLALQNSPKVVAIGETGLDYYRGTERIDLQQNRFRNQINCAKECKKPLIVHTRSAKEDTLKILKQENAGEVGGVLHCFTEDLDMALRGIDLGFYISFSGIVTFSNAKEIQEVAKTIPLDRMLIETDCPFLAPNPVRGKVNQPANVYYVAQYLADLRNISLEQLASQTTKNYHKLFHI